MKIKTIIKIVSVGAFLYVGFFSIQNFYLGYHDLDLSFNMLNLGHKADIDTSGVLNDMGQTYLRGLNQMKNSFIWMILDSILAVYIGMLFKLGVKD